jgi:hypothetical protein
MPKATHSLLPRSTFATLGAAARVLARQAAIALVKDELRRRGERVASVPLRDIQNAADALLRGRPELIEEAAQRVAAHPEWLPKPRGRRSVRISGNAKSATEITTENLQPVGD